jgi:hypothetical protein
MVQVSVLLLVKHLFVYWSVEHGEPSMSARHSSTVIVVAGPGGLLGRRWGGSDDLEEPPQPAATTRTNGVANR